MFCKSQVQVLKNKTFFLQGSMMRQINTSIFRELHTKLTSKLWVVLPLFCARKTAGICICLPFAFCI